MTDGLEMVTLSKKDIEQDARIAALEASKGTLSFDAIKPIATVFAIIWGLATGALGLYVNGITDPLLSKEVASGQYADRDELAELRSRIANVAPTAAVAEVRTDLNALERAVAEAEKEETDRLVEIEKTLAQTLTTEAVDARLESIRIIIENVQAQFSRIISERIQPQIDRHRQELDNLDDELNNLK